MKGISHFSIGVALASFFPQAVEAGAAGNPLYFVLGGIAGLLPDTLDFRFARFLHRRDIHVRPDPLTPDARLIAEAVAHAVHRAWEGKKPVSIYLDCIRVGADLWQTYDVEFEPRDRRVKVRIGGTIRTDGTEEIAPPGCPPASVPLLCDVKLDYMATTQIGAFDGSLFVMEPLQDGRVVPRFIPWHRKWSHSLPVAAAAGLLLGLAYDWVAGGIVAAAWSAHALADQMGFMGSSLLFPFRRERFEGAKLAHASDAFPNLASVWLSCAAIFWNLQTAAVAPVRALNPLNYAVYVAGLPLVLALVLRKMLRRG